MAAEKLGHSLEAIDIAGVPTTYCKWCGVHGTWQWRTLLTKCSQAPRNIQAAEWLAQARQGIQPSLQQANKRPKVSGRTFKRKSGSSVPKPKVAGPATNADGVRVDPLRNRGNATVEDRSRWTLLNAEGLRTVPTVPPPPEAEPPHVAAAIPVSDVVVGRKHAPTVKPKSEGVPNGSSDDAPVLPPPTTDGAGDDIECPRCSGTVLPSDADCAQCGCRRASEAEWDMRLRAKRVSATPITVTCARTAAPLKSALRTAQTSQAGHVTFSDDVILIEVESHKDEHLWWSPEELSDAPRSKAKKAIGKPAVVDLGGPSASRPNGTTKTNLAANPLSQSGATSQNGREALSQRGDGVDDDGLQPKWHGGTLTPPPPMVEQDMDDVHGKVSAMSTGDGVRPRPHQRDKAASESKLHQKLELKCKELSRLDGTARTTPKQVAAVQTPAPSSERVMSAAEERMRNLRERIRVKEGALEAKGR